MQLKGGDNNSSSRNSKKMSGTVAVVLSGCGVFDGSEIHESAAVCVALSRHGKKIGEELLLAMARVNSYCILSKGRSSS